MNGATHPSARRWFWAGAGLTLLKFWLVRGQAIYAIGPADHDDRLFLQLADHLLHGEWLGPYNQLTLAKGPFYSCWIAFVSLLGLPLFFAQHVLYAGACALFVRACRPAIASAAARFWIYALLLCNPITFDASSMGRVLRQHVYGPLALLLFAALIALYLRRAQPLRRLLPWAALLGLAFGCFWLTREESIWIVPSLLLLAGPPLLAAWRTSRADLRRMVRAFVCAGVCGALPLLIVSGLNYRYYRWFGTVEYRATAFTDAYGAMLRVRVGPTLPFVAVTREARAAIYQVSPAFAELRPFLDGGIGRDWAESSEFLTHLPAAEHQIGGGWMMWALRDSVAAAGHGQNAKRALKFYRQMADEINRACDDGRLPAGPPRSGFLPPWREGQTAAVAKTFAEFADFTVSFRGFSAYAPPSVGTAEDLELFSRLTREKLSPGPGTAALPPPDASDLDRTEKLQRIGRALRPVLLILFWTAQLLAVIRGGELLWRRRGSFPLTVAAAAWGAGVACLLINALVHVTSFPVLVISSFAPVYPLVLVFIAAVFWDAGVAWIVPRLPQRAGGPVPVPASENPGLPLAPAVTNVLPWLAALLALAPLVIWHAEFAKLFWFGDDFMLLDQINRMGFGPWLTEAFTENFAPVFKLLWGGTVFAFGGSYFALLVLLWLTHAFNTLCLGWLLTRAGFSWLVVALVQLLFALAPANLETLGWSVQWSAVLATTFFLLSLCWQEKYAAQLGAWHTRVHGPLLLLAAASACSFSRGVLTGAVLALAVMLAGVDPAVRGPQSARGVQGPPWLLAALMLVPTVAVTLVITAFANGNHQHLAGHTAAMLGYAAGYFLLNPGYLLLGLGTWQPEPLLLLATAKLALIYWGLTRTSGRQRILLVLLLAYDLGNAGLLGIGRYHTGFETVISSRYNYSSLLATLPFAALWLEHVLNRFIVRVRVRQVIAVALLAGAVVFGLQGWPRELATFTDWRGTGLRRLLADPAAARAGATVPALEFMRTERAMELIQRYNLH
jgi:hypothetical protein